MKTGKRILSVLLAVLMAASCLTFAFAEANEEEPLYATYKLPYSSTWNLDTLYAAYQDEAPDDITINAGIGVDFWQYYFEPPVDDTPLPTYLLVRADYNRPFYIMVDDKNGKNHCYELKGFQYNSCKTASSGSYYCTECQQTLSVTFPAEHIFTDVITRSYATCTEGEVESRYCARCNAVQTRIGEPLGHNYVKREPVAATCFTEGYTPEKCTRCQKIQMTDIKPATGKHKDDNNDNHCDVCGTIINKTSDDAGTDSADNAPKKNIFQRIIEWFKNLFSKLFK